MTKSSSLSSVKTGGLFAQGIAQGPPGYFKGVPGSQRDRDRTLTSLQTEVLYGPINSRRLGSSLGVNLLPTNLKICSMNCSYCQYGWTTRVTNAVETEHELLPGVDEVVTLLRNLLRSDVRFDWLTFSGNGEPTLHPGFPAIVESVLRLRNRYRPELRVAVLSNGTTCNDCTIREALLKIDLPIMKLDAGTERMFRRLNSTLPPVTLRSIVQGLMRFPKLVIQSMFVRGALDNTTPCEVDHWITHVGVLKPAWVQLYSLDRPPADSRLKKVETAVLRDIAGKLKERTGVSAEVFGT